MLNYFPFYNYININSQKLKTYAGIGSLIGEKKIEKIDEFNGDGKKTQFKLKNCPLKPLQSVEITSNLREFHFQME